MIDNYQILWNKVKDKIKKTLKSDNFDEVFSEVKKVVKFENGYIYVLTPDQVTKSKLNGPYYDKVDKCLKSITDEKVKIKFITESEVNNSQKVVKKTQNIEYNNLNQNYTFESFVTGDSNKFAFLAASKVANEPGLHSISNPLYIFGGVGLGKTHLMQAIGNFQNLDTKVIYVQANEFLNEFTKAVRDKDTDAFDEKYNNVDILLIDDIQMLTDKPQTQSKLFLLIDKLYSKNKQIVITSDCPANKLNGFMDRLRSRFSKGFIVDINKPDLNQRKEILKRKVLETTNLNVPDSIIEYIAENFTNNVRELEGALSRVINYCDLLKVEINFENAKDALNILIQNKEDKEKENYENVLSVISSFYKISTTDILGASRASKIVIPRFITIYILKNKYNLNYSKIGKILNGRDHSSIMNGYNKIINDLATNEELKMAVDSIMKKL
jgi:chromosomal replication initiator protein